MRHEKNLNCAVGAALAFTVALGTVGAMVTGLHLNIPDMAPLVLTCALSALVSALCFRFRWGALVLMGLLVPVSWWLFRGEETVNQTFYMLHSILRRFHRAYGWPIPGFILHYANPASMLRPVAITGALTAVAVSRTVCRRKGLGTALLAAVPFGLCFVVTDTVPDTVYLFLWMLGMTLLILTNGVRRQDGTQGARLAAMAAVPAALALALLFWMVPRDTYDRHPEAVRQQLTDRIRELPELWEQVTGEVGEQLGGIGQTSQVNLRTLGPRAELTYPVMEVTASRSGTLYLRGQDYDVYDGTGWTSARHRTEEYPRVVPGTTSGTVTIATRRVRDILYLPNYPGEQVTLISGRLENLENLREYTFSRYSLPVDWRQQVEEAAAETDAGIHLTLAAAPGTDAWSGGRRYGALPEDTRQWALEMVDGILKDEYSVTEKADAIARYVRSSAVYDTDTPRMPREREDFARWFLEESDRGYCVHFATATAVLLRAAGIDARYVEGYMLRVTAGDTVTVTEDSAHAWVEYYEPVLDAWIVLESTPAELTGNESQAVPVPTLEQQTEPTQPSTEETAGLPADTAVPATEPEEPGQEEETPARRGLLWLLVMGAAAAVFGQRALRLALRRRKMARGSINDRGLLLWRQAELVYRLLKEPVPEEMTALARKARYSRHGIGQEELARMEALLHAGRHRLQDKPWYEKLLHKYLFAAY